MEDNDFLEQLKHERPLHDSWVKKDFLSQEECIYVFYGIEPFTQNEKMHLGILYQEWEFIKSFDFLRLYDMLRSSYLTVHYQNAIPMNEFKKFLIEKKVALPEHLFPQEMATQENVCDEMQLTLPQLRERFVRTYAAYFWKTAQGDNAKKSAAALAEDEIFKGAISYVDLKDKDPKKLAEMFSDLGPRSHKRKKE